MRVAIVGAGVAGLSAAWELARALPGLSRGGRRLEVSLFESSNRLGGIVQTVREGGFLIETGPDGWLSAKPWASELAREVGLGAELQPSNDTERKTWLLDGERLVAIPDGMTLMVPSELEALEGSALLTEEAIAAYRAEPGRAAELLTSTPGRDESVAEFTVRHFGAEVLERIAAPLLSGVFGGDVWTLSARAALPALVQMERTHGSLIAGLQAQRAAARDAKAAEGKRGLFTTLRTGMGTLVDRLTAQIPPQWIRLNSTVTGLERAGEGDAAVWAVTQESSGKGTREQFDCVLLALPTGGAARLLGGVDAESAALLPEESSSAVLVAFAYVSAAQIAIPPGFGLLVAPADLESKNAGRRGGAGREAAGERAGVAVQTPRLLQACTFVDQKFPHRVPAGGRLLRAYFGGAAAARLSKCNNDEIAAIARLELARALQTYTHPAGRLTGPAPAPLPEPLITVVRRLPDSLPQYAVGHLERAAEFMAQAHRKLPGIVLLGNSLHGLGIPDVIRDARRAAQEVVRGNGGAR